jgi:hypothetical protein
MGCDHPHPLLIKIRAIGKTLKMLVQRNWRCLSFAQVASDLSTETTNAWIAQALMMPLQRA